VLAARDADRQAERSQARPAAQRGLRGLRPARRLVSRVAVIPACLRDASYVVANMRPADREEIACQVPVGVKDHELAYQLLMSGDSFIATLDGVPAAFLGTQPLNAACMVAWALGTKHMSRVVPALTRFAIRE